MTISGVPATSIFTVPLGASISASGSKRAVAGPGDAVNPTPVRSVAPEDGVAKTGGHNWELRVTVVVRELIEEVMNFLLVPGVVGWLKPLEVCNRLFWQRFVDGEPPMPVFLSLRVLPWETGLPDTSPEDRKGAAIAVLTGNHGRHEVLQARSHVVDGVGDDKRYLSGIDSPSEMKTKDFAASATLALDPLAHRVWAITDFVPP
jgi:hypothetical protein